MSFCWCMIAIVVLALYLDKPIGLVTRRIYKHPPSGDAPRKGWLLLTWNPMLLTVSSSWPLCCWCWISCRFLQDDGSFMSWHKIHHFSAATLCTSNGSFSKACKAPGISASVSVTITWGSVPWGTLSWGKLSWDTLSWGMRSWSANIFRSWNVSSNGEFRWQIRKYVPASGIIGDNARCHTSTCRFSTTE